MCSSDLAPTTFLHEVDAGGAVSSFDPIAPPRAWLNFVNVHPDYATASADFYIQASSPAISIPAGIVAGRMPVISGVHDVDVTEAGQPRSSAVASLTAQPFPEETNLEVIFWGDSTTSNVSVVPSLDPRNAPGGGALLQAFHASAGIGPVDVWFNGSLVVDDLGAGTTSSEVTVTLSASMILGLDVTQDGVVDFNFDLAGLEDRGAYTVVGATDGTGPYLLVIAAHQSTTPNWMVRPTP